MSEVIYKYDVPVDDEPHTVGFFPVHVACQNEYDTVQVWCLVDPSSQATRQVQVFATGQPIPAGSSYVGTVVTASGALVWHVFDVTEVNNG